MTTHHTLELDRPLDLHGWAHALTRLIADYPELGSRIEPGTWPGHRPRRVVVSPNQKAVRERLIDDHDGSHTATERWMAAPIDPHTELPFRVRISRGLIAEQAVCLSLHHSVSDGAGALALFDRFIGFAAQARVAPRQSTPLSRYPSPTRSDLSAMLDKIGRLRRPAAQLVDHGVHEASGQQLVLRTIGREVWLRLGRQARAAQVTRTTALWHAVASVLRRQPLDDVARPVRIIAGVNLRGHFGVPSDALGNWLGTLEHEHSHSKPEGWAELHRSLSTAKRPKAALVTPSLLRSFVAPLPVRIARAVFRQIDSDAWPSPFTLLLAPLRLRAGQCWPARLQPRRLWCASTLPRKPGIGLTFTEVGDQVVVAATCQAAVLRRATLARLVDDLVAELGVVVAIGLNQSIAC